MEKKFDKYKKRKTRIRKVSNNYSFTPNYNSSSPSQAVSYPITQMKIESKSDYLYDIDIIIDFIENLNDIGFKATAYGIVGMAGGSPSGSERGDIYKIKNFLEGVPSWRVGTINYNINIDSYKVEKPFDILKSNIESLRGRLDEMTNCRIDHVNISTDSKYSEQYTKSGIIKNDKSKVSSTITITNVASKRPKLEN